MNEQLQTFRQTYAGRAITLRPETVSEPAYETIVEQRYICANRREFIITTVTDALNGYAYANLRIHPKQSIRSATLYTMNMSNGTMVELDTCHSHRSLGSDCGFFIMSDGRCLHASTGSVYSVKVITEDHVKDVSISYNIVIPLTRPPYHYTTPFQKWCYLGAVGSPGSYELKVELQIPVTRIYFFLPPDSKDTKVVLDDTYAIPLEPVHDRFELRLYNGDIIDFAEALTASVHFTTEYRTPFVCNLLAMGKDLYTMAGDDLTCLVWTR